MHHATDVGAGGKGGRFLGDSGGLLSTDSFLGDSGGLLSTDTFLGDSGGLLSTDIFLGDNGGLLSTGSFLGDNSGLLSEELDFGVIEVTCKSIAPGPVVVQSLEGFNCKETPETALTSFGVEPRIVSRGSTCNASCSLSSLRIMKYNFADAE